MVDISQLAASADAHFAAAGSTWTYLMRRQVDHHAVVAYSQAPLRLTDLGGAPQSAYRSAGCLTIHIAVRPPNCSVRLVMLAIMLVLAAFAEPVAVRNMEGEAHGFLVLRTLDGAIIADGDLTQVTHGSTVTNRVVFHFKDGSIQDETAVFSQRGQFRLLRDHLVQKGLVFKRPMDVSINGSTGTVTVRYEDKAETKHLDLPEDLANGMIPTLLKNLAPGTQSITVPMVVATPNPILVKLAITAEGEDSFSTGGASRTATRYVIKMNIGGVRGVVAPLLGKQPPDTRVWISGGSFPMFLKSEGPSFESGPIWRTELVSPVWPKGSADTADRKK